MRLFNIFGSKTEKKEVHPLNDLWSTLFNKKDSSLITNNIEAFEKISWVFKCTEVVAMKMATVPYSIYIGDTDTIHQKLTALFKNPNQSKTKTEFILSIVTWQLLKGFAIVENQYPYIAVLDSDKIQLRERQLYYGERRLDPKNYAILRNYNYRTGSLGLPQISALMPTVKLQSAMEVANKSLLDNGAIIPFVLSTDQQLAPATVDELREQIQKNYSGPERAGTVPIFHSGIKPERIGISPMELGIIAQEGVTKSRISTVFGVPSIYINDMQNVNYATAKTQQELFIRNTIMPRSTILGEQLESYVIPMFESKPCRIYFDWQSLPELQEDEDKRAERDVKLVNAGIYTINEIRDQRKEEPVAWGNEWWRSYGLTDGTDMIVEATPEPEPAKYLQNHNIIVSKNMTDNDRGIYWKMYVAKTFSQEKKMESVMKKFFKKQQKYIIENYTSGAKGFFPVEWNEQLQKILKPLYYAYGAQAIDGMKSDYNISFTFDTGSQLFASYVKQSLEGTASEIIKTTEAALTKEFEEAMRTGEAPDAIANRVNKVFDFAEKYRAKRIARTEVNGINNETMYMVASDAKMEKKQWTTSLDEVRDSHMAVDGLTIGINELFELAANFGFDYIEKPGDQNASPENRINCRCVAIYQ